MRPNSQKTAHLVTFTEEIFHRKLQFCSVFAFSGYLCCWISFFIIFARGILITLADLFQIFADRDQWLFFSI